VPNVCLEPNEIALTSNIVTKEIVGTSAREMREGNTQKAMRGFRVTFYEPCVVSFEVYLSQTFPFLQRHEFALGRDRSGGSLSGGGGVGEGVGRSSSLQKFNRLNSAPMGNGAMLNQAYCRYTIEQLFPSLVVRSDEPKITKKKIVLRYLRRPLLLRSLRSQIRGVAFPWEVQMLQKS
jgi:hypothetical protein